MKRIILFIAIFAALLSCSKEINVIDSSSTESCSIEFEASAPISSDANIDTKTTLIDHSLVHWSKGDKVLVQCFPMTNFSGSGKSAPKGIFDATFTEESKANAYFSTNSWSWGDFTTSKLNAAVALYPATSALSSNVSKVYDPWNENNVAISYDLSNAQTAEENSFQSALAFSYAEVNFQDFIANNAKLSFKNSCSLIRLTLPNTSEIVSVEVKSKSGQPLTGKFELSNANDAWSDFYRRVPNYPLNMVPVSGETSSSVVLSATSGATLKAGGIYYIVVWPGSHSSGLEFTFTNSAGKTCVKSLNKDVLLEASKYVSFKFTSAFEFTDILPELNIDKSEITVPASGGTYEFKISSNVEWSIKSNASFVTVSPSRGAATDGQNITVTVSENASTTNIQARSATLTIMAANLSKQVMVNQAAPEKRYYIKEQVAKATNLVSGSKYVIFLHNGTNVTDDCWKINDNDQLSLSGVNSKDQYGFTSEYVFEIVNGAYSTPPQGGDINYDSRKRVCLKSLKDNTMISTSLYLSATSTSSAMNFLFCTQWATDTDKENRKDFDIWAQMYESGQGNVWKTLYWNSSGSQMQFGTVGEGGSSRKWYVYRVE